MYRRVLQTTSPSSTSDSTKIHSLTEEIDVVKLDGYLLSAAKCKYNLNSYFSATDYIYTFFDMQYHEIKMKVSMDAYLNKSVVLIVEYTKTTD